MNSKLATLVGMLSAKPQLLNGGTSVFGTQGKYKSNFEIL